DLFDASETGAGASGNAAALVTPRLDAGDNAISALFADAYAYAGALYRRYCPEAVAGEGLSQCASGPRDRSRFARIVNQAAFLPGELALFDAGEDVDVPENDGIRINGALWVRPRQVLDALTGGQTPIRAAIRSAVGGVLTTDKGETFGGYDAVIWACGEGIFDHAIAAAHDLRPVRGQVEWAAAEDVPGKALSWGGYCIPLDGGLLFGATHERGDRGCDVREADRARNLDSLAVIMPGRSASLAGGPFHSRARVRVMTRDYLPAMGELMPGQYVLTGLGARGFCLAPLLAKALLAEIACAPSPLPAAAKNLLNIARLKTDKPC
ncbi:MAG: FAD-dependent oxidoreductase, partial [Asticcacaulis sp.]